MQTSVKAADGTEKFLLQLADGRVVETVGIPVDDQDSPRLTVCVSSQVRRPAAAARLRCGCPAALWLPSSCRP